MISFNYEIDFGLNDEDKWSQWIEQAILDESCKLGEINFIFCSDAYLLELNVEYLNHDTYTDIISFDYSVGKELHGDIYISLERVKENAKVFGVTLENELGRVMIHGVLHLCGYKDKSGSEKKLMRSKENFYLVKRS
ncbi:rRNA maturation RNase YbeY [Winogradskyella aurantia]|uniref:Endoribonuclease YbeY n=1 Tax=Winogradskyella aurantia TaxID=1915063 RepID=A0A265V028_9FLAO|nr:rRNA maturation RNase YbeY [Winogradskyella aurantia]OZV70842.1 rRNA maturation RNase YbeY [Winogradskyella aurantia]